MSCNAPKPGGPSPTVSVVLPTYNGERFLRPAIESILSQTLIDFELIVVDDCSTDRTPAILTEFKDDRLTVLHNKHNLGIAGATNKGLAAASGNYIALQDHDDISRPHRLQTEVDYLDTHPEVALVSSAATLIDDQGVAYGDFPQPTEEIELKWQLLWACPIHHTAVMVRRTAMVEIGGYSENPDLRFAEAWDPLARIAMRHPIINLPDRLVLWRRHSGATSIKNREKAMQACDANVRENIYRLAQLSATADRGTSAAEGTNFTFRFEGLKAFLFTPAGQLPDLPGSQVLSGFHLLRELRDSFYGINNFAPIDRTKHSRRLDWTWGKHALALSLRTDWDYRVRSQICLSGLLSLGSAAFAGLRSVRALAAKPPSVSREKKSGQERA